MNDGYGQILPDDFETPSGEDEREYIDCSTAHIGDDDVYWEACTKHTDIRVETWRLRKKDLEALRDGKPEEFGKP